MIKKWASLLVYLSVIAAPTLAQDALLYTIDSAKSKVEVNVYREGVLKFLGHDHLIAAKRIAGLIQLNKIQLERSSVQLKIDAKSLVVVDPGVDDKERREVQAVMESERVLDVERYPEITFTATSAAPAKPGHNEYELVLSGELSLHGVVKRISLPLRIRMEGNALRAQGETTLLQTDYNIKPVRVGGGTVKVKDRVKITFDIVALQ